MAKNYQQNAYSIIKDFSTGEACVRFTLKLFWCLCGEKSIAAVALSAAKCSIKTGKNNTTF